MSKQKKIKINAESNKVISLKWFYVALFSWAIVLYANTFSHEYAFDDAVVITGNQYTQKGTDGISDLLTKDLFAGIYGESLELTGGRYRPLTLLTHALEYEFFGEAPGVSHVINVLLYACLLLVLFRLMNYLFKDAVWFNFLVCVLYAAHPVHTEVVANIKSRDEILSFLFLGLTLIYFIKGLRLQQFKFIVISTFFYLVSLFAKENGITFLFIIPLSAYFFTEVPLKKILLFSTPFFIAVGIYLGIRAGLLDTSKIKESTDLMENPFYGMALGERFASAVHILFRYVWLLVLPLKLSSDYSYAQIPNQELSSLPFIGSFLFFAILVLIAIKTIKQKNIYAYSILFFLAGISIVSNLFFNIGAPLGERFLFIPSFAYCIAIPTLLFQWQKTAITTKPGNMVLIVAAAITMLYSVKTINRNPDWKNNLTLFEKDSKTASNSAKIHYYYANSMLTTVLNDQSHPERKNYLAQAKSEFYKAVNIYPSFHLSWYNLGLIYNEYGMADSALYVLNTVLKLQPNHILTQGLIGSVYGKLKGDLDKSIFYLERAVKFNPKDAGSVENLGIAYAMKGRHSDALKTFERSMELNPNNPQTYYNLGALYANLKDSVKSNLYFQKAEALKKQTK